VMTMPPKEPQEDVKKLSFWMPGNYVRTVHRTQDFFQVCDNVVACFKDRARVEKQYSQQLRDWSSKWRSVADSRSLYGSLMTAWQAFFSSAERLSLLHSSISHSLVSEEGERIHSWRTDTFKQRMLCGFHESHDFETAFTCAQKPWVKKLKKLEKARLAYHKSCEKEQSVLDRECQAKHNSNLNEYTLAKIQQARERATQDRDKARNRYEKVLEDVTGYTARYMEEMEAVFEQSQEQERKRISFLKQAFLSIHRHLDITNNDSVKEVYAELHHTLLSISEEEDLHWWRVHHGPGMPTTWPALQEWVPPGRKQKPRKKPVKDKDKVVSVLTQSFSPTSFSVSPSVMIGGVRVRALYNYVGEEADELSFNAGEEFLKVEEEDEQGWCRGVKEGGVAGFYPAKYALPVQ
uniref:Uncharacterized protein n=1 Tax=Electrophorus electricus TaxID=8005 RepID=A0A4W4FDI3_ELEEL